MALSGWFVALLALGAVPTIAVGGPWGLLGWLALCGALIAVDLLAAGSPRELRISREKMCGRRRYRKIRKGRLEVCPVARMKKSSSAILVIVVVKNATRNAPNFVSLMKT